jgi:hypothetical protein
VNPVRRVAVAAVALTAAAVAGLVLPAAAAPVEASLGCRLYFSDAGTGTSPTTWADTFTLSQTPASPAVGQTVTVTLAAVAGVTNGPVPLAAGDVPVRVTVVLGGAQTGTVTLNQAAYPASATAAGVPLGPVSAGGTYTATAAGTVSLTVRQVAFANTTATTYCSAGGDRDHKAAPVDTPVTASAVVTPAPSGSASPSASASPSPSASQSPSASVSASASSSEAATPAETFGPASVTMRCKTLSTIRDWTATHTLTMSPANPGFGADVTVTYTFDNGGRNGPAPIAAGDLKPTATVRLGGVQSGTVQLTGPAYGAIAAQATVPAATLTGRFTAGTPGQVALTVANVLFDHPQVDTVCNKGSDPVTSPADTTIVAKFTVRSTPATAAEATGQALPKTGDGNILPVIVLWGTALLLTGAGALVVIPSRRKLLNR